MADILRGPVRVMAFTTASGAGGNVVVTVRPPVGEVWDLQQAFGWHDDAVRTVGWSVVDTIGPLTWAGPSKAATLNSLWTVENGFYGIPIRLTYALYLTFTVLSMAGAKNAFVSIITERLIGCGSN